MNIKVIGFIFTSNWATLDEFRRRCIEGVMMSSSPPPVSKNWPAILLSCITSISSITGFLLAQKYTQNLLLEILITCVSGIVSFFLTLIIGITTKVRQHLEETWAKRIADGLDTRFLRYRRRYLSRLFAQHRHFDTKGLIQGPFTFDLDKVFVELSIASTSPHKASADPLKIPDALRTGQYPIWDYLAAKSLSDKHLVIIGAPGSGKTTLLQHIVLIIIDRKEYKKTIKQSYKVPFLLFLRNYGNDIREPGFSLVDAIHKQIDTMNWPSPPSGWVERQLTKKRCLILLDGLDELPEEGTRREMSEWIQRQLIAHGENRFIITARPYGYSSNPLQGVDILEVKGFSQSQVERFVHNWYLADWRKRTQRNDPGVSSNAKAGAEDLLQRIRHSNALSKLAVNPLLLTMITTVHQNSGVLPDNRVTLYEEMCKVLLGKRREAQGVKSDLSIVQELSVLRPLAYYMMLKGKREIPLSDACEAIKDPLALVNPQWTPEKFLKMIEESSGLWVEPEPEVYGFTHMTFQEYLTAMHIKEEQYVSVLEERVEDARWHETIRLYCARADATSIIIACLKAKQDSVSALQLALDLRAEASQIQPALRAQVDDMLDQVVEEADPVKWKPVAEARLAQRMTQMVPLNDETYLDTSLISRAEYRLFLEEQQALGQDYRPDHWLVDQFPPSQGQAFILGIRPSDAIAFCSWLTMRDTSGTWCYRLPTSDDLEKEKKNDSVGNSLIAGIGYWVDEGEKFVWLKGNPGLSDIELQERSKRLYYQSYDRILSDRLDFDRVGHRDLVNAIKKVQDLAQARTLHQNVIRIMVDLRRRIRERERALQTDFNFAHDNTVQQQTKLKNVQKHEQELKNKCEDSKSREQRLSIQIKKAQEELSLLPTQIKGIDSNIDNLQTQIENARREERKRSHQFNVASPRSKIRVQSQMDLVSNNISKWQEERKEVLSSKHNSQTRFDLLPGIIQNLESQLEVAHARTIELQFQLTKFYEKNNIGKLQKQLEDFSENEQKLQLLLNHFRTHARPFYDICDRFLGATKPMNTIHLISSSLSRNQALHLDHIRDNVNSNALAKALDYVNDYVSIFAKDLVEALTTYQNMHISIDNNGISTSDDIARALVDARKLASMPFKTNCQTLVDLLTRYLIDLFPENYTTEKRQYLRRRSLHRLSIRYLTQGIIGHFCYWSWKELFSFTGQLPLLLDKRTQEYALDPDVIEAYIDVYVILTILEERIEGQLSPCEGLLLVRELRTINTSHN